MFKIKSELAKSIIWVFISAVVSSLSIHAFINPAQLYPAGFLGLTKFVTDVVNKLFHLDINFVIIYFATQIVLTIFVIRYIGKRFALLTILQFSLVTIFGVFLPNVRIVDDQMLLVLFGGVIGGLSVAFALKGQASTGGTDFVAVYLQNSDPSIPVWDYIMYFNWTMLVLVGLFNGWQSAMYSMIYQFVSTTILNNMDSRNKLSGLYIITDKPDEVSEQLFACFNRGITKLMGEGAYTKTPRAMLFMVVGDLQVNQVIKKVRSIDPKAFINVTKTEKVVGNFNRQIIS